MKSVKDNKLMLVQDNTVDKHQAFLYSYFVATKVNPTESDKDRFIEACKDIHAEIFGFDIFSNKEKVLMTGFMIVDTLILGDRERTIHFYFPNFLVTRI